MTNGRAVVPPFDFAESLTKMGFDNGIPVTALGVTRRLQLVSPHTASLKVNSFPFGLPRKPALQTVGIAVLALDIAPVPGCVPETRRYHVTGTSTGTNWSWGISGSTTTPHLVNAAVLQVGAVALGLRSAGDVPSGSATTRPRRARIDVVHQQRW